MARKKKYAVDAPVPEKVLEADRGENAPEKKDEAPPVVAENPPATVVLEDTITTIYGLLAAPVDFDSVVFDIGAEKKIVASRQVRTGRPPILHTIKIDSSTDLTVRIPYGPDSFYVGVSSVRDVSARLAVVLGAVVEEIQISADRITLITKS